MRRTGTLAILIAVLVLGVGIVLVAILISMIGTGMNMMGMQTGWIDFMKGLILLFSIVMSMLMNLPKMKVMFVKKGKGANTNGHEETI